MRGVYYNQESNKFIEGPIQSDPVNNILQEGNAEKAAYHADLTQGYELNNDANEKDTQYHDTNERYD